jgi:hypothetical protein
MFRFVLSSLVAEAHRLLDDDRPDHSRMNGTVIVKRAGCCEGERELLARRERS